MDDDINIYTDNGFDDDDQNIIIEPKPMFRKRPRKNNKKTKERTKKMLRLEIPTVSPPFNIKTIEDLIHIGWYYKGDAFDWFTLWKLIPALTELNMLVGMTELKQGIINFIIYYLQDLQSDIEAESLNTVLYGVPGSGKTTAAHILAKIYSCMGYLSTQNVVVAKRADFIQKWVGHSESKTLEILKSALGGVLFIDEAYSFGSGDGKTDSFSKAAVDTINQFLSENKGKLVCIIAGYKDELDSCFFSINPGLKSRFPWKYDIKPYSASELNEMFERKVKTSGWVLDKNATSVEFFKKNMKSFPYYGRDIDSFFMVCKTTHSRRIFGTTETKKLLVEKDINDAIYTFKTVKDMKEKETNISMNMLYL